MKVVVDTNVLIAAFISPRGKASEVLERCIALHIVVSSEYILQEFREKMIGKFGRDSSDVDEAIGLLRTRSDIVVPTDIVATGSRDAKDNPILGTGVAGRVQQIITGDKDLLSMVSYRGIRIIKPADFLEQDQNQ